MFFAWKFSEYISGTLAVAADIIHISKNIKKPYTKIMNWLTKIFPRCFIYSPVDISFFESYSVDSQLNIFYSDELLPYWDICTGCSYHRHFSLLFINLIRKTNLVLKRWTFLNDYFKVLAFNQFLLLSIAFSFVLLLFSFSFYLFSGNWKFLMLCFNFVIFTNTLIKWVPKKNFLWFMFFCFGKNTKTYWHLL